MEETLRLLYQLQKVDTNLDELTELKGDLPAIVEQLDGDAEMLSSAIKEKEDEVTKSIMARDKADVDILEFQEKLEKYKKQQYQVRNNKEYDAITKEIDFANESIQRLTKEFVDFENAMTIAKGEIAELNTKLEGIRAELKEKKGELTRVSKETEDEELKFKHEREKIIVRMKAEEIVRYERIRKARGGIAVANIRRNSCSGCNNKIPPQHILEIRNLVRLYTCQHCGRIVVSDDLVQNLLSQA